MRFTSPRCCHRSARLQATRGVAATAATARQQLNLKRKQVAHMFHVAATASLSWVSNAFKSNSPSSTNQMHSRAICYGDLSDFGQKYHPDCKLLI